MNNDNLPRIGFCISKNNSLFIANDSITNIEIKRLDCSSNYRQVLINDRVVYQISAREIDGDNFVKLSRMVILKLIEHIRFNFTSNIDIDNLFSNLQDK